MQEAITPAYNYRSGYRRQLEIYQWLFRRSGFPVSSTAYLVYANGRKDRAELGGRLEFELTLIPCIGDDGWVEQCVVDAWNCLHQPGLPNANPGCSYCLYRSAARERET
jgi:hypothetical protein